MPVMTPADVRKIEDPERRAVEAHKAMTTALELVKELAAVRAEAVAELRIDGASHGDVAGILGISRAAAARVAWRPTT